MYPDEKRILVVYPHGDPLNPSGSGGQNRLYHLIKQASKNHEIYVIGPTDNRQSVEGVRYQKYNSMTPGFISDLDVSLARQLYDTIDVYSPNIIYIPYPSGIIVSKIIGVAKGPDTKIILDAHDVMSERAREFKNDNLGPIGGFLRKVYAPTLESIATRLADHILTVSEKDRQLMLKLNGAPKDKITSIPNGAEVVSTDDLVDPKNIRKELNISDDEIGIVFHGNYKTGTHNLEAANHIINQIAPEFSDEEVHFFIIGDGAPESKSENITSLGFVEDLYSVLNAMDIAIVPLSSGTATKLKMFDYMSVGLPIVSTEKGTEGIDVVDGKDVLISDIETNQFTSTLSELLRNDKLRATLSRNSKRMIDKRYNWDAIGEKLNNVLSNL